MIEIYLLEQLDAFQRCGTLSKAAEELHISQPALSRSMKKLEEKMGLSLFDRDNRKIALNKTGELTAVYARNILEEERKMIAHVTDFDRSLRVITLGACATVPITHLMPLLQHHFPEKSILAETADDKTLITRLKNRSSQLVVLHELPSDKSLFCQRYLHEQLYISVPKDSPLSDRSGVSMKDLKGLNILVHRYSGFWLDICRENLPDANLLIQDNMEALAELVEASSLPVFNSSVMLANGYVPPNRVNLPVTDVYASVDYYITCLVSEKKKYSSLFNAVRVEMTKKNLTDFHF